MPDDVFSDDLRGYLRRRDHRVRSQDIEWPRAASALDSANSCDFDRGRGLRRWSDLRRVRALGIAIRVADACQSGDFRVPPRSARTRRLPMTRKQGKSSCSAGSATTAASVTPGSGTEATGAAAAWSEPPEQIRCFDGVRRETPPTRAVRRRARPSHQYVRAGQPQRNLALDGNRLERIDTPHTPTSNGLAGIGVEGAMAYDAATGRVVLVTSATGIHFVACSTQTWTFDGSDWRLEAPATPLPAVVVAAVDEPLTGHVIAVLHARAAVAPAGLAGTSCPVGSPAARALPQSSTWRWTGSTWVEVSSGTEPEESALEIASNGTSVGLDRYLVLRSS